jgi:hypothetical protein
LALPALLHRREFPREGLLETARSVPRLPTTLEGELGASKKSFNECALTVCLPFSIDLPRQQNPSHWLKTWVSELIGHRALRNGKLRPSDGQGFANHSIIVKESPHGIPQSFGQEGMIEILF